MRIAIAEDLVLLRDGLTRILQANDIEVVAAVGTVAELEQALEEHDADLVILDIRLPPTFTNEGLQAGIELRRRTPGFPVVVLSQYVQQLYARELFQSGEGAIGYLLKDRVADVPRFVETLRHVAAGGTALDPKVVSTMIGHLGQTASIRRLTPRETDVLSLMAQGRSNAGIADALVVSEGAVTKHIHNIFTKLDLYETEEANRRVLAVLEYLNARSDADDVGGS